MTTNLDYQQGYEDGRRSRDAEVEALERLADDWYFRANNPRSEWPEHLLVKSIEEARAAIESREQRRAELDAIEAEKFDTARMLIDEGEKSDVVIAKKAGLLVTVVANLRKDAA